MKTYDTYALFPEGSYLVASSNDQNHASSHADRVMKKYDVIPHAVAILIRGEHKIGGEVFGINDLIHRHGRK